MFGLARKKDLEALRSQVVILRREMDQLRAEMHGRANDASGTKKPFSVLQKEWFEGKREGGEG